MEMTLALQVAAWRKFRGMQQGHLAGLAGITRPRLSDVELGKAEPEARTLHSIARALDCSVSQLYDSPSAGREREFVFASGLCYCDDVYTMTLRGSTLARHCGKCGASDEVEETE